MSCKSFPAHDLNKVMDIVGPLGTDLTDPTARPLC
jgi:hypothetical protein